MAVTKKATASRTSTAKVAPLKTANRTLGSGAQRIISNTSKPAAPRTTASRSAALKTAAPRTAAQRNASGGSRSGSGSSASRGR